MAPLATGVLYLTWCLTRLLCLRDELKKLNKEKAQLVERLKEAETAQSRLDGEMHSLRASTAAASDRQSTVLAETERNLHKARELAQSKQDEVGLLFCACNCQSNMVQTDVRYTSLTCR